MSDILSVTRVYTDVNNKACIVVTNPSNAVRTLLVRTPVQLYTFEVQVSTNEQTFQCNEGKVTCYDTTEEAANKIYFGYASVKAYFTDFANAIREKTGETDKIARVDIPEKIGSITGGDDSVTYDSTNEKVTFHSEASRFTFDPDTNTMTIN